MSLLHSIPFKHAIHFLACITLDHTHLCIGGTHNNLKLDNNNDIEFCQEYKYLGVTFDTSGTDDTHTHTHTHTHTERENIGGTKKFLNLIWRYAAKRFENPCARR